MSNPNQLYIYFIYTLYICYICYIAGTMNNIIIEDNYAKKQKYLNALIHFVKNDKDEQFLEYILSIDKSLLDLNLKDDTGNYLIFIAVVKNKKKIVQKLIEYHIKLDSLDIDGYGLLYYPIKYGFNELFDILIETDKQSIGFSLVNMKDNKGGTPLLYALKYKNEYALQELLIHKADANCKTNDNANALHLAVLKKEITFVRMIVKYIKNINARTVGGATALHYACNFGLYYIAHVLLEAGARQDFSEYEYSFYPIFYSVAQNNIQLTELLLDRGADPNWQDYLGNTIIHYSIMNDNIDMTIRIIDSFPIQKIKQIEVFVSDTIGTIGPGLNSNSIETHKDFNESTTQGPATKRAIVPNLFNIDGFTIGHLLLYNYRIEYQKILSKILPHCNLNHQDNNGNTMTHIIIEKNLWLTFAPYIKINKINIYIKNNMGITPFDKVQLKDKETIINTLVTSYYTYLKKHNMDWLLEWQNKCSGEDLSIANEKICLDNIRKSIIEDKISVPITKNKKNIIIEPEKTVHISTFTGSLLDVITGYKYLTKKYSNTISLINMVSDPDPDYHRYIQSLGIHENQAQKLLDFEIKWVYQTIFFPANFSLLMKNIITKTKYRYIIIPIAIILSNGNHSNALLYDIQTNTMERFEPHGYSFPMQFNYNSDLLDEVLYKHISQSMNEVYKNKTTIIYYRPRDYLPNVGFQTIDSMEANINKNIGDPNGFCVLWCIWYLDYRLKYHNTMKPPKIVTKLLKSIRLMNVSFRTMIRDYSKNITDLRDMYLSKINKNIHDYINNRIDGEEKQNLINAILEI